jgi:hypothetical protein
VDKTRNFTVTKISWLMLFNEVIAVYTGNHLKPINTNAVFMTARASGAFSYHWDVKG